MRFQADYTLLLHTTVPCASKKLKVTCNESAPFPGGVDFTQGALWPLFQGNKADVCVAIKEQADFEGYECFHVNLKTPESGWVGCEPTKAIGIIEEGLYIH